MNPLDNGPEARAYMIWRVDCDCGAVLDYGEDEGQVPAECEYCGAPVRLA